MIVKHLGLVDYASTYEAMQRFTRERDANTPDELWLCEHPSVYTLGLSEQTALRPLRDDIACIKTNRGGQITYHGPGQIVAYPLVNLSRLNFFVREYVFRLEEAIIKTLNHWGITAYRVPQAPGVYVNPHDPHGHGVLKIHPQERGSSESKPNFMGLSKIAALGVKVSKHFTYHGLALNVSMDLSPFSFIHPCGYEGLMTTDLRSLGLVLNCEDVQWVLAEKLQTYLSP
jgi:lipoyl(octanoyl) transferase